MSSSPWSPSELPISEAPPPKKPNWTLIIGVVAGLLILCTLLICVVLPWMIGSNPEQFAGSMAGVLCQAEYPDLSASKCQDWGDTIFRDHPTEFRDCQRQSQLYSGTTRNHILFSCLEEKGLAPENNK